MRLYFLLIYLASLLGHRKAKLLYEGQWHALEQLRQRWANSEEHPIWFHVASVGEFEQARPIIEHLRTIRPKQTILLTFFSPSGYELRKNYDRVDQVTYLPFATVTNAKTLLDVVQPSMVIFVKYEFWPAYLRELQVRAIPTYLISAIFRSNQLFFRPWGRPYFNLLRAFRHLYVQDEFSKQLLMQHGLTNVTAVGDTRFDRVVEISAKAKQIPVVERFTEGQSQVLVAGSTWLPDEQLLIRYVKERPDVRLVLVPHEIDEKHLHRIFQLAEGRCVRYTQANDVNVRHVRILIVDTIGLLSSIYRYGHVAYVGGGFGVGIHNTLEPAVYGMPVLFGPNYQHFREALGLIDVGAGVSVRDYNELAVQMDNALEVHKQLGKRARQYVESELGASHRIYDALFDKQGTLF